MPDIEMETGSFRDPAGKVFYRDGSVYRSIMPVAREDYEFTRDCGLLKDLMENGLLVGCREVEAGDFSEAVPGAAYVLKHEKIPFISYPYEWPFQALKEAALCQLAVHMRALEFDVTLSDATAYNVQFKGTKPVFIDVLSLRKYRDGEFWTGNSQFYRQYLNPLLMRALFGVPHNSWFRGELDGVDQANLRRLLSLRHKFSLNIWLHVILPDLLQNKFAGEVKLEKLEKENARNLPKARLQHMLGGLAKWITRLKPKGGVTVWQDYAENNSYQDGAAQEKMDFVKALAQDLKPAMLWDLGCNTGAYSEISLAAGAARVIGFDFDTGALDGAFQRGRDKDLDFLPLFMDATNPSPDLGWALRERKSIMGRKGADAVLALAFVHHLAIGANIPLDEVVEWITGLAPSGVVEFVPKSDPMVLRMLMMREDIFPDYTEENFAASLQKHRRIMATQALSGSGRKLFRYGPA
ncbi:MAG: hypothetical protein QGF09_04625 [Rhodospirillales bacterium]|nr:hypothetical protein [Rhodospirillales bacterium]